MIDDQTRILISDWYKMKKYIPEYTDQEYTPKFGYVTDYLREHYGLYVIAKPSTNSDLDIDTPTPQKVYNFRGETAWIKENYLYKFEVCTHISYYGAMRDAINIAIRFLEEN